MDIDTHLCIFLHIKIKIDMQSIFLLLIAYFWHDIAYFCIFLLDPFLLPQFLAILVPFQPALQQQVRVNSSLPMDPLHSGDAGAG